MKNPFHYGRIAFEAVLALLACSVWAWAILQLGMRKHFVGLYKVSAYSDPLVGFQDASGLRYLLAGGAGVFLFIQIMRTQIRLGNRGRVVATGTRWLLGCSFFLFLDYQRAGGLSLGYTFIEPLLLALFTGEACAWIYSARKTEPLSTDDRPIEQSHTTDQRDTPNHWNRGDWWLLGTVLLSLFCLWWWYQQSASAYEDYLLGYPDFGQFARRVVSTSAGRGFLLEAEDLPIFWDHFNPGLVLLVPLWKLWPSAKMFFLLQAACLAVSPVIVFLLARKLGLSPATSAGWSVVYVMLPSTSQINFCGGYGWHPITVAMPLLLLTFYWILAQRWVLAIVTGILACSFKESVVFLFIFLSGAAFLASCLPERIEVPRPLRHEKAKWGCLAISIASLIVFALITKYAGFAGFQTTRFAHLGTSTSELLLSPFTKADAFFGHLVRSRCIIFMLALMIPFGMRNLLRINPLILSIVPSFIILCQMKELQATSIGFQYVTTLLPVLMLVALTNSTAQEVRTAALGRALGAAAVASLYFGMMPYSHATQTDLYERSYVDDQGQARLQDRLEGSPGNHALDEAVAMVNDPEGSVLATARVAAHLITVRRLELVDHFLRRNREPEGNQKSRIVQFDYVVLDYLERFHQDRDMIQTVLNEAKDNGFRFVLFREDVIVMKRQ